MPGPAVRRTSRAEAVPTSERIADDALSRRSGNDEIDGIQMLEQKDVLDYDSDGNTAEVTRHCYHGNALGSVMEIMDLNQAMAVSYRYDPYGRVTITVGGAPQTSDPLGQHWTFTGRFSDEESGLHYCRARNYDPVTGRFLQRDPLGYVEGPNVFEYVRSNAINATDPSGLWSSSIYWWMRWQVEQERRRRLCREIEKYLEENPPWPPEKPSDIVWPPDNEK